MVTTLNPSSLRMRSIRLGGMLAEPVTATRRLDRSVSARRGWASSDRYKVGAPGSTVTRSRAMRSNTSSASNTAWGRMVAPAIRHVSQPAL
ncbi:hypothetical protein D3C76_1110310 [compost metagenome]